jgi:CRP/FNR family transcriptional regulator, cyclic AMP receptor protein
MGICTVKCDDGRNFEGNFSVYDFLGSAGGARRVAVYGRSEIIYSQGDPAETVMYVQKGGVRLSVVNGAGKEAVVAILAPGDFFGEGCLAGQNLRRGRAVTTGATTLLVIGKQEMIRLLHAKHDFLDHFVSYMLKRNIRIEEDLIDQLFNSSEKRLARALLLLARHGKQNQPQTAIAKISQETLAEIIGTTRSRVNFFMNKFKRMGFVTYKGRVIHIDPALQTVVLPQTAFTELRSEALEDFSEAAWIPPDKRDYRNAARAT